MPRTKQFDEVETLDKAMGLFWLHGFEATSIQDLVETMGINRGSLYDSYGDKRTLFTKALERYDSKFRRARFERIEAIASPRQAIETFLNELIDESVNDSQQRGCMIVNTVLEFGPHDPAMAQHLNTVIDEIKASLRRIIERGQERGEFNPTKDAKMLASVVLHHAFGIRVMARIKPERQCLEQTTRLALSALD